MDIIERATTLRIIFMGTPDFAVASLEALLRAGYNVVAVVTAPDKPAGRGLQLQQSAVKKYAVENDLTVLQPAKLRDPEFLEQLQLLKADVQVIVAFRMLPEVVWAMPPMGTINVHGSLLPQYRGAAPINWAIINGETETGVTTFKLQHQIDMGNILLQQAMPIGETETAGSLHDRMKLIGAALLVKTIGGLQAGTIAETPQPPSTNEAKHAPKIDTETCRVNWQQSINNVYNQIRGLAPYPAAYTELDGKKLKLFNVQKEASAQTQIAGNITTDKKSFLKFACTDGFISVDELQLEGKKRMHVADFLRGYHFS